MENLILMSYNYVKKGGTVMREYKGALCELINKIDKKSSLEWLYKLDEIKRRGGLNSSVLLFVKCQFNITTVI